MNYFIGNSGGDGGYGAWRQCTERARDAVALAAFAGERHGAAGVQGREVGAAGGGEGVGGVVQRQRDLPGQGAVELLLLSALFVREGYPDDPLHGAGPEDGVCGGGDMTLVNG